MKKLFNYICVGIFAFAGLQSCDLDTSPTNYVDEDLVLVDSAQVDKVLTGAWVYAMETYSTFANPGYGAFLRAGDAMGSDAVLNTKYGFASAHTFASIYGRGTASSTNSFSWTMSYKVINNMNVVLASIKEDPTNAKDEKNRMLGQAYAFRGFMYLHLASLYSFAIDKDPDAVCAPIYTEPSDRFTKPKPAASVKQVYAQTIGDLEKSLTLIPTTYKRNNKSKIDRQVATGLLARASLYAREWEKAKKHSDDLLALNGYLMNENEYKEGFNDATNEEWIWGHLQNASQSNSSYNFNYLDVTSSTSSYFSFNANPYFRDLFDDADYRKSMIYWYPDPGGKPENQGTAWMRYAKFIFKQGKIADQVLMRTSEIYLINAEAKARLGQSAEAINSLNKLKSARKANSASGLSGQTLLDAIWIERRKELFGEGFALVDIIRNQQTVVRKDFPQSPKVSVTFTNSEGNQQTKDFLPQGHRILKFPNKEDFAPNSKYYLFRIPEVEEIQNSVLYSEHPKLDIYK